MVGALDAEREEVAPRRLFKAVQGSCEDRVFEEVVASRTNSSHVLAKTRALVVVIPGLIRHTEREIF